MLQYFRQILIKENEMQYTQRWCREKLKKLQEISNKIKYFYAERVVAVYSTKLNAKIANKLPKSFDRNCCVRIPEMAFQSF